MGPIRSRPAFLTPDYWRRGELWVWITGLALGVGILMIAWLVVVIAANALGFFWPARVVEVTLANGEVRLGEVQGREAIPGSDADGAPDYRILMKVGNRDVYGLDFRWIDEAAIASRREPRDAAVFQRAEYGDLHGYVREVRRGETVLGRGDAAWPALEAALEVTGPRRARIREIQRDEIGAVNYLIERARLSVEGLRRGGRETAEAEAEVQRLQRRYDELRQELDALVRENDEYRVTVALPGGGERELGIAGVIRAYRPNAMGWPAKVAHYAEGLWEFLSADPREANTEGGVFPAIFGTVMMTLIMSVAVVPLGVLAALYLREYAREGPLVRVVRIGVNNLAGVPSIVFGVFGLGFFVYFVGGSLDGLFFSERLPTPTFGTGGILWASLTLALLTVPVVIVATEEALAAVPRTIREASYGLGATRFQTISRIVLPGASSGILTGLILAMARGAGEVAPLMITGVVKLAPTLPVDGFFPYVHLDRKFMHLGFHIYDVGFQSPNVEAARPMVYATTLLLLAIVVLLNAAAIGIRTRLRRRYRTAAF